MRTAKSTDQNVFILSVSILIKVYSDLVTCSCNDFSALRLLVGGRKLIQPVKK